MANDVTGCLFVQVSCRLLICQDDSASENERTRNGHPLLPPSDSCRTLRLIYVCPAPILRESLSQLVC